MSYSYSINVTYNANGGSGAPSSRLYVTESAASFVTVSGILSSTKPTKTNYKFLKWRGSDGNDYYPGGSVSHGFTLNFEDQTWTLALTAVWQVASEASTFDTYPSSVQLDGTTNYTFSITKGTGVDHHTLKFSFVSKISTHTNVDTSKTVYFPLNWCNEIPNSETGIITVSLTSYASNNKQIGEPVSINVTANVPQTVLPTMTVSHSRINSNSVINGWDILVQGYSKISFTATASGARGSTIASYSFSGPNLQQIGTSASATSDFLSVTGSKTWTVKATDSRGRSVTVTYTETIYEYAKPVIKNASAKRCDSNGTLNEAGGLYGKFYAKFVFSSCNGNNFTSQTLEYCQHGSGSYTTISNSYVSNTNVVFGGGNLAIDDSFDVRLTVQDALGNEAVKVVLLSSVSGFSIGLKNDRARFGGVPVRGGLQIDWRVYAPNFAQIGQVSPTAVNAGDYIEYNVVFTDEFAAAPIVVASLYSINTLDMGFCECIIYNVSKTGFRLHLVNNSSQARNLGANWIAVSVL